MPVLECCTNGAAISDAERQIENGRRDVARHRRHQGGAQIVRTYHVGSRATPVATKRLVINHKNGATAKAILPKCPCVRN
jgi:hypothetical protein